MEETKQVAALPVRKGADGQLEVLLVTSRETGRWVIPKGWPSKRLSDREAAAREARQEAGVVGTMKSRPIGTYRYRKVELEGTRLLDVTVYLLKVAKEKKRWPEQEQRQRTWFKAAAAARRVREPSLQKLIRELSEKPPQAVQNRLIRASCFCSVFGYAARSRQSLVPLWRFSDAQHLNLHGN